MSTDTILADLLDVLVSEGRLDLEAWPEQLGAPEDLGLLTSEHGIFLKPDVELLSASDISNGLSATAAGWIRNLEVLRVTASTNARLMLRGESESVAGLVCIAELQTQGRGRRGRAWLSPFAGQLALSMGVALNGALHELGGISLVVGLAVIDCLRTLGVEDPALKWPNDILLRGRKLGGILIELKNQPGRLAARSEAVIGVGLNVDIPASIREAIDQPVTDLRSARLPVSRNRLASVLVSNLVDYLAEFEKIGFAPMRDLYNDYHMLHQRICEIRQGEQIVVGRVAGVTEVGEIMLETDAGTSAFSAGEVSLRWQE
ncbi:MAG: biotin--[acetyl-CoA-carboxylase] ligase [Pseudomonadales bacterium]|jgi:BirA family biotin operon repressor/biotin-[acetyl-CoA-carboxylase] ligase